MYLGIVVCDICSLGSLKMIIVTSKVHISDQQVQLWMDCLFHALVSMACVALMSVIHFVHILV